MNTSGGHRDNASDLASVVASVDAAVGGDLGAISRVLSWTRPRVVRYCRARVGPTDGTFTRADAVAQQACLAVLTALPSYHDQGQPFLAFVYDITTHTVAAALEPTAHARIVHRADVSEKRDLLAEDSQPRNRPSTSLHSVAHTAAQRADLLAALPDNQREIVLLRLVVGLSTEETAQVTGSTPGAIRAAQHRALATFRHILPPADTR